MNKFRATRRAVLGFCAMLGVWASTATIFAQEEAAKPAGKAGPHYVPPSWPQPPDTRAMLGRLAFGTGTVLFLSVATLWAAKHWLKAVTPNSAGTGRLQVLESVALGQRCSVVLLSLGQQQFLAGVDAAGLKSLIPVPESFASTLDRTDSAPGIETQEASAASSAT